MPEHRLTRDELSWLLAQEARGAAKALREGVSQLGDDRPVPATRLPEVRVTLDALDGAIDALSQLQAHPEPPGRRGRIDAAALLVQLAPHARIAIEPGAGTEVFGDETTLRRMLHVMLSQSSNPAESDTSAPEIHVRGDGEFVRLSVVLGPDQSATAELERRWLNRVALRMGGRLELEGGEQALLLPADDASVRHEVVELRRELEQAKQLGEAYARELAEVFTAGIPAPEPPPLVQREGPGACRFDLLTSVSAAIVRQLRPLLDGMDADVERVRSKLGDTSPAVAGLQQQLRGTRELLGELQRVANTQGGVPAEPVNVFALVTEVTTGAERRAARHGVALELEGGPCEPIVTRPAVLTLLVRSLLDHAIAATPRAMGISVRVRASATGGVELTVRDGGPGVEPRVQDDLLRHRLDPTSIGRPAGVTLLVAHAAAALLGAPLALGADARGGLAVSVTLERRDPGAAASRPPTSG